MRYEGASTSTELLPGETNRLCTAIHILRRTMMNCPARPVRSGLLVRQAFRYELAPTATQRMALSNALTSDGTTIQSPRALARNLHRLQRL